MPTVVSCLNSRTPADVVNKQKPYLLCNAGLRWMAVKHMAPVKVSAPAEKPDRSCKPIAFGNAAFFMLRETVRPTNNFFRKTHANEQRPHSLTHTHARTRTHTHAHTRTHIHTHNKNCNQRCGRKACTIPTSIERESKLARGRCETQQRSRDGMLL